MDAYQAQIVLGTRTYVLDTNFQYVIHALISRLLKEEKLQTERDELSHAIQRDSEDEMAFNQSIMDASRV